MGADWHALAITCPKQASQNPWGRTSSHSGASRTARIARIVPPRTSTGASNSASRSEGTAEASAASGSPWSSSHSGMCLHATENVIVWTRARHPTVLSSDDQVNRLPIRQADERSGFADGADRPKRGECASSRPCSAMTRLSMGLLQDPADRLLQFRSVITMMCAELKAGARPTDLNGRFGYQARRGEGPACPRARTDL